MGIAALKYKDTVFCDDIYGITYPFNYYYKGTTPELMINVLSGVDFSLPLNATGPNDPMTIQDIYTYSNGVKYSIKYRKYVVVGTLNSTYYMEAWTHLTDKNGNLIREIRLSTPTTTVLNTFDEPWLDCKYTPGRIEWSQNRPTVIGEEANNIAFDMCYYNKVDQVLQKPFYGDQSRADFVTTWAEMGATYVAYDDSHFNQFINGYISAGDGSNPFSVGTPEESYDPSGTGGGDKPEYGPTGGDPIDFPDLPTGSIFATGILSAYNPSAAELTGLASELWSNAFVSSLEKLMNDPFQAIVGLMALPLDIPAAASATAIKIGNYTAAQTAKKVTAQYVTISGGSFTVPRAWNNFLDYVQTECDVYMPFAGFMPIDIDDCMGKTLSLQYNIDLLTGSGVALLKCDTSVLYAKPVNIAVEFPLTGSDKAALYTGLINVAATAVTGAAVGGVGGAVMGAAAGSISTAATKTHSNVDRSGALSANTGVLGELNAYVVLHRPTQSLPKDFKKFTGYTSNVTAPLAQCKGYTEVEYVHLTGIEGATDAELQQIETLLKSGVII